MTKFILFIAFVLLVTGCAASTKLTARYAPDEVTLALTGRLVIGIGNQVLEQQQVLLAGERIVCVGSVKQCPLPDGVPHIDAGDGTMLPGLIDLHVHLRAHYLDWFLAAGVTSVRDANNAISQIETLLAVEKRPRLFWTGPLLDGSNTVMRHFGADGVVKPGAEQQHTAWTLDVATAAEAEQAVRWLASQGASFVKLYEQLEPEVYQAAATEARAQGMRIMTDLGMHNTRGLTAAKVDALQAITAGVHTIEHASGYALAYQRLGGDPNRLPFDEALIEQLAQATVRAGVAIVPTLSVSYSFADDVDQIDDLPAARQLKANQEMFSWYQQTAQGRAGHNESSRLSHLLAATVVKRVHQLGGIIGAGSDAPAGVWNLPGGGIHRELELLVRHGLTPIEALETATRTAADILGRQDLGRITEGALADIIIVAGNPVLDIKQSRQLSWVIKNGVIVKAPAFAESPEE